MGHFSCTESRVVHDEYLQSTKACNAREELTVGLAGGGCGGPGLWQGKRCCGDAVMVYFTV